MPLLCIFCAVLEGDKFAHVSIGYQAALLRRENAQVITMSASGVLLSYLAVPPVCGTSEISGGTLLVSFS